MVATAASPVERLNGKEKKISSVKYEFGVKID
jgi:hypothetical protein